MLFGYTFPTTWACSGLTPVRARPWRANKEKPRDEKSLGFGKIFTDHMFVMDYIEGSGWINPRIEPYHPFMIDPSCNVLHYAQEVFEGLKAYRTPTNDIQLFRPLCNAERMQDSCDRLCIPKIPTDDFLEAVTTLVELEKDWVPHSEGTSLYKTIYICFR